MASYKILIKFLFTLFLFINFFLKAYATDKYNEELIKEILSLKIERLKGDHILQAQKLSYDAVVRESGVDLAQKSVSGHNPFNKRIVMTEIGEVMLDDYDTEETVWIGAINKDNKVVGCGRFSARNPKNNKLKCEFFIDKLPEHFLKLKNMQEVGRAAIHPDYRKQGGLLVLRITEKSLIEAYDNKIPLIATVFSENGYYIAKNLMLVDDVPVTSTLHPRLRYIFLPVEKMPQSIALIKNNINLIASHLNGGKSKAKL